MFQSTAIRNANQSALARQTRNNSDALRVYVASVEKRKARLNDKHTSRNRFPVVTFGISGEPKDYIGFSWNVEKRVLCELIGDQYEPVLCARAFTGWKEAFAWAKAYHRFCARINCPRDRHVNASNRANLAVLGEGDL